MRRARRIDFVFVGDGATRRVAPRAVRCVFDGEIGIGGRAAACSDHVGVLAELELVEAPAAAAGGPDSEAVELALGLLAEGRAGEQARERGYRTVALAGAATLGLAAAGARLASTRRRFLRRAFYAAGFLAIGPGAGSGALSEHYAPEEERAFEQAAARLAALDRGARVALAP